MAIVRGPTRIEAIVVSRIDVNPAGGADVRAVVLIPAYGQPLLTAEALRTAVAQRTDSAFAVVVVNDGCPCPETHEICLNFATTYPAKVFYLSKANGGLSAARNSGLEFALAAFPTLEAVYFLDCDNHMGPLLLQRLLDALRHSDENVGWAYTDVDKFGFASFYDTSGHYSPLEHLSRNFCEAGSMVSRRMLDAGVRFDTAMRKGAEDWDFWLQGLDRGFRGVHVPDAGFRYRRRGESMLVEAERDFAPIFAYIRSKHPRLYSVGTVLRMEIEAQARYAVYHPDTGFVRCMTVAGSADLLPLSDYVLRLLRATEQPGYGLCPGYLVIMDQALYEQIAQWRLLAGILWTLEYAVMHARIAACSLFRCPDAKTTLSWTATSVKRLTAQDLPSPPEDAQILAIEAGALLAHHFPDGGFAYGNHLDAAKSISGHFFTLAIGCEEDIPSCGTATDGLAALREDMDRVAARESRALWRALERDRYRAHAPLPQSFYPEFFDIPSIFPAAGTERCAALVVDDPDPATLKLAARLGVWLRAQGWTPHLVAFGDRLSGALESPALDIYAGLVLLPLDSLRGEAGAPARQDYMGVSLPLLNGRDKQIVTATLAGYSLVVSIRSAVVHLVAGALRRLNVQTWTFLPRDAGRTAGDAAMACAAFEQAYDAIFPETGELMHLCRALGIAPRKLRSWPVMELAALDTAATSTASSIEPDEICA